MPRRSQRFARAGSNISRGFFNDYDADGSRDVQPQETIQFLSAETAALGRDGIGAARYVAHVSANYRPRLDEVACELKRRIDGAADIIILDGAERTPRYSSAEMHKFAYKAALSRQSGRSSGNAIIMPMSKTAAWWEKTALERHSYFYPHHEDSSGSPVKGHAEVRRGGHYEGVSPALSQPRRLPAPERIRLHHVLRMHRREPARCSITSAARCGTNGRILSGSTCWKGRSGGGRGCFAGNGDRGW